MDLQLVGKRALVTGSSQGMGEAIAHGLAAEGVRVAIHGRNREAAERVTAEIAAAGGNAVTVLGDLTVDGDIDTILAGIESQLGGVDILVNNAGGSFPKRAWQETPTEEWAASFDRNVLAAVRMTQRLLPAMRASGWGRIVNISSVAGQMPPVTGPDYSACKAAMKAITSSLAKAVAADGITVNSVSPGTILTPKLETTFRRLARENAWAGIDAERDEIERAVLPHIVHVPMGRVGQPSDIAHAVAFLCSPLAGYITGIDLRIDGGSVPTV